MDCQISFSAGRLTGHVGWRCTRRHSSTHLDTAFGPPGRIPMVAFTWRGAAAVDEVVNLGPLALIEPLLDRLEHRRDPIAICRPIRNRSTPMARCCVCCWRGQVPAHGLRVNVAAWAEKSGAANLRQCACGRSSTMIAWAGPFDAFFDQRHSILGSITAQALHVTAPPNACTSTPPIRCCARLSHLDATP